LLSIQTDFIKQYHNFLISLLLSIFIIFFK